MNRLAAIILSIFLIGCPPPLEEINRLPKQGLVSKVTRNASQAGGINPHIKYVLECQKEDGSKFELIIDEHMMNNLKIKAGDQISITWDAWGSPYCISKSEVITILPE